MLTLQELVRNDPKIQKDHIKHIVKSNFVSMQVVNMSAYIQSQISTVNAQSGFYEGHMAVSDVYGFLSLVSCYFVEKFSKLLISH